MGRFLRYIILLSLFVGVAVWLSEQAGTVTVDWGSTRIQTPVGVAVAAVVVFGIVLSILYRVWRGLVHLPEDIRLWRRGARLRKGYDALTQGMVAVAAGDPADAKRQAARAREHMEDNLLSLLLAAEAAQIAGDDEGAERLYRDMLDRPEIEFLGLRGLLVRKLREGNAPAALHYAERAAKLRPKVPWIVRTLFDLQTREERWVDAQITLAQGTRAGVFTDDEAKRLKGMLLLERGEEARANGRPADGRQRLVEALGILGSHEPTLRALGETELELGKPKRAAKVIEDHWPKARSVALADIHRRATLRIGPAALSRIKPDVMTSPRRLHALAPEDAVSHRILGEAALENGDWLLAREQLDAARKASGAHPSADLCRVLARLEEGPDGDSHKARMWLERAAETPRAIFACNRCGSVFETWKPHCTHCHAFDSVRPVPPPDAHVLAPSGADSVMSLAHDDGADEDNATPQSENTT